MDLSAIGSSQASAGSVKESADLLVLKKAIDLQAQNAQQLLEALPKPQYNNPPNMGKSVDTFA